MAQLLFDGKTCKAEYIAEKKTVLYTIIGYINVEENKEMYLKVFEFMKSNLTIAFMHDFKQMRGTFTQMNDWIVELFRPATQLGLKYEAMILNDDVFTQFAANDVIKKVTIVQIQVFKTREDADKWIDEKLAL